MKRIVLYLSKLFPFLGLIVNKFRFKSIKFEIGDYVEMNISGKFTYGNNLKIGQKTRIDLSKDADLFLGNNVSISRNVYLYPYKMKIGNNVKIQDNNRIYGNVIIGNSVILAPNIYISSSTHNYNLEEGLTIMEQDKKYVPNDRLVVIEDDCWIGINVVIMPGVKIAKGCVIGSNSVVTKDTEEYTVYGGIPAIKLKNRY